VNYSTPHNLKSFKLSPPAAGPENTNDKSITSLNTSSKMLESFPVPLNYVGSKKNTAEPAARQLAARVV
jgi:hypothetical protein